MHSILQTTHLTDIQFFGGQGSLKLSDEFITDIACTDAKSSSLTQEFLQRCYRAFREETTILYHDDPTLCSSLLAQWDKAEDLLYPCSSTNNSPIIEGTKLYLFQVLRYLANLCSSSLTINEALRRSSQTIGFCSGILPAVVVAASETDNDFLTNAVEAYRLAFWIGYRVSLYAKNLVGESWMDQPWALAVFGRGRSSIISDIEQFNEQDSARDVQVATILKEDCVTIGGPSTSLERFSRFVSLRGASTRHIQLHSLYHGGEKMMPVLKAVIGDTKRRDIKFPTQDKLIVPSNCWTALDCVAGTEDASQSLAVKVLGAILVSTVDWPPAFLDILTKCETTRARVSSGPHRLFSYGPSTNTLMHSFPGLEQIELWDVSHESTSMMSSSGEERCRNDVAIVGMGLNFPNGDNLEDFWNVLKDGLNCVQEIPNTRFNLRDYKPSSSSPDTKSSRIMKTSYGNFIKDPWYFDNDFFNISPREAKSMDPQQRILLHTTQGALEDAGYVQDITKSWRREKFGCYVGVATGDYIDSLRDDIDVYYSPGTLRAFLSGRLSYVNKWSGPSVVVDTACSSSIVAIHQACRALTAGDCDAAIAGGVNVICGPDMYLGLGRGHFLSSTGQCKPFDANADGYCRSEGSGIFVLKRITDALRDKDRIRGVIRGCEVNQSGNASSITHPHASTQKSLFEALLRRTNIDPESISVVEAHGTGTKAGDPVEIDSLDAVLSRQGDDSNILYVSSIKGNIGHSEAASGAAGLAKLVMMLSKKIIPKQVGLETLNPEILLQRSSRIVIPSEPTVWSTHRRHPRRALLNNFGAAGSNGALIIEEFLPQNFCPNRLLPRQQQRSAYVFRLSAKSESALDSLRRAACKDYRLRTGRLQDLSYTSMVRRPRNEYQLTLAAATTHELFARLKSTNTSIRTADGQKRHIVFVFSGQGGQHIGMARELFQNSPFVRRSILQCDAFVQDQGFTSFLPIIQAASEADLQYTPAQKVQAYQCAVFAVEYALSRLWMSWNVVPSLLLGHSLGEYVALVIAGALSLPDGLHIVARRAFIITEKCASSATGMLAVNISAEQVDTILTQDEENLGGLCIGCKNSPTDCVVSGGLTEIDYLQSMLKESHIKSTKLNVPYAYHSMAMDPIRGPLEEMAAGISFSNPTIPVASNVYGRLFEPEDLSPSYLSAHATSTVRFHETLESPPVRAILTNAIVIEVGPHPITLPMIKTTIADSDPILLCSLQRSKTAWASLNSSLVELSYHAVKIDWQELYFGTDATMIDFPGHPLNGVEYRLPYREPSAKVSSKDSHEENTVEQTQYTLIPEKLSDLCSKSSNVFRSSLKTDNPLVTGHTVNGVALCPASVYIELMLEAAMATEAVLHDSSYILKFIKFSAPLVHNENGQPPEIRVTARSSGPRPEIHVEIASYTQDRGKTTRHCTATLRKRRRDSISKKLGRHAALSRKSIVRISAKHCAGRVTISQKMLYDKIFPRVVSYSPSYQSIQWFHISEDETEGYGEFTVREDLELRDGISQPTFTDTLLHAAGFLANCYVNTEEICICVEVNVVQILQDRIDHNMPYRIYTCIDVRNDEVVVADAFAFGIDSEPVASIEGMRFRRMKSVSFKRHLTTAAGRETSNANIVAHNKILEKSASVMATQNLLTNASQKLKEPLPETSNARSTLASVIANVTGVPLSTVLKKEAFADLGIDSMMMIELLAKLQVQFKQIRDLDEPSVMDCSTLSELETFFSSFQMAERMSIVDIDASRTEARLSSTSTAVPSRKGLPSPLPPSEAITLWGESVCDSVAETVGMKRSLVALDTSLGNLGIDSMMLIELASMLTQRTGTPTSEEALAECQTPRDIVNIMLDINRLPAAEQLGPASNFEARTEGSLVHLQKSPKGGAAPLYLIHDGSGLCSPYSRISSLDRKVFGISAKTEPNDFSKSPVNDIECLAAHYISLLDLSTPVILGGWSFGGVLAFAMSRLLRKSGQTVLGTILIDSPCPVGHQPLPQPVIDYVCSSENRVIGEVMADNTSQGRLVQQSRERQDRLKRQFATCAAALEAYNPPPSFPAADPDANADAPIILLRSRESFDTERLCGGVKYPFLSDRGGSNNPLDSGTSAAMVELVEGWARLAGPRKKSYTALEEAEGEGEAEEAVVVLDIPGNHFTPFERENVQEVSRSIKVAIEMLEGTKPRV